MVNAEYIIINNEDYLILDEIEINNIKYLYLCKEILDNDLLVQKIVIKDNVEHLVNLDDTHEYELAMQKFKEKNDEK